jgi:hypothetical protein
MRISFIIFVAAMATAMSAGCGGDDDGGTADAATSDAPDGVDAGTADAAVDGGLQPDGTMNADAAPVGIECGPQMFCDLATTQGCCLDQGGGAACTPQNGTCMGALYACDGKEECMGADYCCNDGVNQTCGDPAACLANLGEIRCHGDGDCPGTHPNCCQSACSDQACQ